MGNASGIRAGRAFVEIFGDDNKLVRVLNGAKAKVAAFGRSISALGSRSFGGELPEPLSAVQRFASSPAGVLTGLLAATRSFSDTGDAVAKMSRRTGASTEFLSEMGFAAQRSGTSMEALETGLRKMSKTIVEAASGSASAEDALNLLGVSVKDLAGLSPEGQFELLAAKLYEIKNPTLQAAAAMEVFGKQGTQLLPLIQEGPAGLAALRQQARDLGMTISGDAAASAEGLNDALGDLWATIKKGAFEIGGALAPTITDLSNRAAAFMAQIIAWTKDNQELIVTVFKITAAVVGAGVGLSILGGVVGKAGVMFGLASKAITAIGAIVGFILSPVGLVTAALVGLGAWFVSSTETGQKMLGWLGDTWEWLKGRVVEVFGAIANAVKAGDIGAAWGVVTAGLKLAWANTTAWLLTKWEQTKDFLFGNFPGISMAFVEMVANMRSAWASMVGWLKKLWIDFQNSTFTEAVASGFADWFASLYESAELQEAKKVTAWRKSGASEQEIAKRLGGSGGAMAAKDQSYYDKLLAGQKGRWSVSKEDVQAALQDQLKRQRAQGEADKAQIDKDTAAQKAAIEASRRKWEDKVAAGTDAEGWMAVNHAQTDVDKAKADFQDAMAKAKAAKAQAPAAGPLRPKGPGGPALDVEGLSKQKMSVAGTFNAALVGRMGGSSAAERTADGVAELVRGHKRWAALGYPAAIRAS